MKSAGLVLILGSVIVTASAAQTQTNAQAGAQAGGQASVQAGKTQAQAGTSSSTSAVASAQNGQANAGLANGTAFNAALTAPVDSKKCKPGDEVKAHTIDAVKAEGKTVIPKGTKLVGHVTQASARANDQAESSVGILFDKAILKNGQEVALNVAIRALASAQTGASQVGADADVMGSAGGSAGGSGMSGGHGAMGGVTSSAGGVVGGVTNTAANAGGVAGGAVNSTTNAAGSMAATSKGAVGGLNAEGQLTSNSQGVFGLNGLNLNAGASNATEGSVITSAGKNVHLDSGTRMLLVTQAQAGAAAASRQPSESKPNPKSGQKPESEKPEKRDQP
jgi:hypothetical protein